MYTIFYNKVLTENTTHLLWRTILGQSVELYNQLAIILPVLSPGSLRIHLQIYFIIYIYNAVCLRQIFTTIYPYFLTFHQKEQHQKIPLCNPLMYTLRQFCFQMEFCTCQYNFLFCLWHVGIWLWSSICCYLLSYFGMHLLKSLGDTNTISPLENQVRKKKYHSNHLANSLLKPSCVWNLSLSEADTVQSFAEGTDVILVLKKSCCKETVASICLLSDGLLFKAVKTTLRLRFPAGAERT